MLLLVESSQIYIAFLGYFYKLASFTQSQPVAECVVYLKQESPQKSGRNWHQNIHSDHSGQSHAQSIKSILCINTAFLLSRTFLQDPWAETFTVFQWEMDVRIPSCRLKVQALKPKKDLQGTGLAEWGKACFVV